MSEMSEMPTDGGIGVEATTLAYAQWYRGELSWFLTDFDYANSDTDLIEIARRAAGERTAEWTTRVVALVQKERERGMGDGSDCD